MHRALIGAVVLAISCGGLWGQDALQQNEPEAVRIPAGTMVREIIVDVRFFVAKPETLRRYGLAAEGSSKTFPAKDLPELLKRMVNDDPADLMQMAAPKLTMISGQRAYIAMTSQGKAYTNYVRDCLPGKDPAKMQPVIGSFEEGLVLDLKPSAGEKDGVVYTFLAPRTCEFLGMRECSATVVREGKRQAISWEEPVLLIAEPGFQSPCDIRVKAGETLVVPLDYIVQQGTAAARAFALDGKVKEVYAPAAKKHDVKAAPADRLTVCVLTATVKPPVPAERDMELPQFDGPTFKFELAPGKVRPADDPIFEHQPD